MEKMPAWSPLLGRVSVRCWDGYSRAVTGEVPCVGWWVTQPGFLQPPGVTGTNRTPSEQSHCDHRISPSVYLLSSLVFSMPNMDFSNLDKIYFIFFLAWKQSYSKIYPVESLMYLPKHKRKWVNFMPFADWSGLVVAKSWLTHPEVTKKPLLCQGR